MKICCIPVHTLSKEILSTTESFNADFSDYIKDSDIVWIERFLAEKDFSYKQIIPYVILRRFDEKIACYQRHGTEKRLHGFYSCGFGGHIEETDKCVNLPETIEKGMIRELSEEITNFQDELIDLKYLGIINETESDVGLVHLGLVFLGKCKEHFVPLESDETKGLEWKTLEELNLCKTELWTKLALKLM